MDLHKNAPRTVGRTRDHCEPGHRRADPETVGASFGVCVKTVTKRVAREDEQFQLYPIALPKGQRPYSAAALSWVSLRRISGDKCFIWRSTAACEFGQTPSGCG